MQGKMKEKRQETCVDDDGEGETSGEAASSTVKSTIISSPSPSRPLSRRDGNKTRHSAGVDPQSCRSSRERVPACIPARRYGVDMSGCNSSPTRSGVKLLCYASPRCRFIPLWTRAQCPRSGNTEVAMARTCTVITVVLAACPSSRASQEQYIPSNRLIW